MRIREVWIRFYKSFNFDYELKATPGGAAKDWQLMENDGWMPHVRVPIEPDVTAVVGANESGKTHLLDAVKIALTGDGLLQRDFCRSSSLFSVENGSRLFPEVGLTVTPTNEESATLAEHEIPLQKSGNLLLLRQEPGVNVVVDGEDQRVTLSSEQSDIIQAMLPHPHELETEIALPDSVSIAALAQDEADVRSRKERSRLMQILSALTSETDVQAQAASLIPRQVEVHEAAAQKLGVDLLVHVARIERSSFVELQKAIAEEREGLVNGLIQEMNNSIARHLNISRWWTQDPEFQLRVSPREHELVFTIRDRTGTDYSFTERSRGLRYFLSYYVQLLAHDRPAGVPEVLLMDEPDAYLSALGQQDLLRVLEHHARPDDSDREDQVVYVTHSPFLINRNAGHRVRVVDKGVRDEGTRLVKDATRNHYEPLRTSLGAFVAETAFIGGDNLFVEGISDQVLLAGMNARLLRGGMPPSQCLDLNQVTIVHGGSNVPYMLYLARGRDQIKPACAVLIDGDTSGETMQRQIQRGGAHGRPTVSDDLVINLADWARDADLTIADGVTVREPEDIIPTNIAVAAARRYARSFLGADEESTKALTEEGVRGRLSTHDGSHWDALADAFQAVFDTGIAKAGFAKELLALLADADSAGGAMPNGAPALQKNFAALIQVLADTLALAREREADARRDQRLQRIIETFSIDFAGGCTRDRALSTLKRIDAAVDDTFAGDVVHARTTRLRRDFKLTSDPLKNVDDYNSFLEQLKSLKHLEKLEYQGALEA